jgi:hypothetical protein
LLGNTANLHLYCVQTPSQVQSQGTGPYFACRARLPSVDLVRLVRLVRTFYQIAATPLPHSERLAKAGRENSKFGHLDKTKDLAQTPGQTRHPDDREHDRCMPIRPRRMMGGQLAKSPIAACAHGFRWRTPIVDRRPRLSEAR